MKLDIALSRTFLIDIAQAFLYTQRYLLSQFLIDIAQVFLYTQTYLLKQFLRLKITFSDDMNPPCNNRDFETLRSIYKSNTFAAFQKPPVSIMQETVAKIFSES